MTEAGRAPVSIPYSGASARSTVPSERVWMRLAQPPDCPLSALKNPLYPPDLRRPAVVVLPSERCTPTEYGTANMSTCELLNHTPESLRVYSAQWNRMLR